MRGEEGEGIDDRVGGGGGIGRNEEDSQRVDDGNRVLLWFSIVREFLARVSWDPRSGWYEVDGMNRSQVSTRRLWCLTKTNLCITGTEGQIESTKEKKLCARGK